MLVKVELEKVTIIEQDVVFLRLKEIECKNIIRFL